MFECLKDKYHKLSEDDQTHVTFFLFIIVIILIIGIYFYRHNSGAETLRLLARLSTGAFFYYGILLLLSLFSSLRKKEPITKTTIIIILISFFISIPYMVKLSGYETKQIGHFFEADEYTEKRIVIMSRDPKTDYSRKEYTLKAEIERQWDYYPDYEELNYHINCLYFDNEGYRTFDADDNVVVSGTETTVTDDNGDTYYITLVE